MTIQRLATLHHVDRMRNAENIIGLELVIAMRDMREILSIKTLVVVGSAKLTMIAQINSLVLDLNVLIHVLEHVAQMHYVKSRNIFLNVRAHEDWLEIPSIYVNKNL